MPGKEPDESPQATLPLNEDEEQSFPPGPLPPVAPPLTRVSPLDRTPVRAIMTKPVFTTFPDASLLDAAMEMHHHHVTGLPVVAPGGGVSGIVSETDVMRTLGAQPETGALGLILPTGTGRTDPAPIAEIEQIQRLLKTTRVADAMTPDPVTVSPDVSVAEASRILLEERVNRLPVVERGLLVGIVTRHDVVRAVPARSKP